MRKFDIFIQTTNLRLVLWLIIHSKLAYTTVLMNSINDEFKYIGVDSEGLPYMSIRPYSINVIRIKLLTSMDLIYFKDILASILLKLEDDRFKMSDM